MLVILKIPVVYLCAVVWWAIRAEPQPLEGAPRLAPLAPTPRRLNAGGGLSAPVCSAAARYHAAAGRSAPVRRPI